MSNWNRDWLEDAVLDDDGWPTSTSEHQKEVEDSVERIYKEWICKADWQTSLKLLREEHSKYLLSGLLKLRASMAALDASRPWLCYWILHALDLIGASIPTPLVERCAAFLLRCQSPTGGFGGGPGQLSHLAPTYASINALAILGSAAGYAGVDRDALVAWMMRLRLPCGAFRMHEDGEEDVRGAYCAASVAAMLNLDAPGLFDGTAEWIASCQTYEGGYGAVPFMEAHGGYTFCAVAGLILLGREDLVRMDDLTRWIVNRQMSLEGGFQGRTNKLVDGCYSFWQGGTFPLLRDILKRRGIDSAKLLFSQESLQRYILMCCQEHQGGLIDKPGKSRDFYHTCYVLSGLSIAQSLDDPDETCIIGQPHNTVAIVDHLHNVRKEKADDIKAFFSSAR
eukprot:Opistho-2@80807